MSDIEKDPAVLLLIDDDMVSREIVSTLLALSGAVVHTAEDGEAALHLLANGICAPSLILMDARMPGLSGLELIQALRSHSQGRIVLISASDPSAELRAAADGFLLKPFGIEELNRMLSEQLPPAPLPTKSPDADSDAAAPDLNLETLAQLRRMMPEASVREIYVALLADLDRRGEALQAALAARDYAQLRRIGHAIKGGAALSGATRIARLGALIESGGLEMEPGQADAASALQDQNGNPPTLFVELQNAIHQLRGMLNEMSLT